MILIALCLRHFALAVLQLLPLQTQLMRVTIKQSKYDKQI